MAAARQFHQLFQKYNYTVEDVMSFVDQDCKSLLERCKWKGIMRNCSEIFEERKTYIGYCCSFNYLGVQENISEDGSVHLYQVKKEVERTRYYSHRMGLTVLLDSKADDYLYSTLFSAGVRMMVHNPDDYPDDTALEKILPLQRELLLRVTATSSYCTEAVRDVNPKIRDCIFPGERTLKYFPLYTAINCLTECRVTYIMQLCSCTPFYYYNEGNFKVCNLLDIPCLNGIYYKLRTRKKSLEDLSEDTDVSSDSIVCDCPALCNDVTYDVQLSSGDFKASQFQRSAFFDNVNVTNRILFHFYFGNHVSIRTRRDIISSWNNLLSSLGGVFSLFLGCSFVSAIEVIYFFTLRFFLRYRTSQTVEPVNTIDEKQLPGMRVMHSQDLSERSDIRRLKNYSPIAVTNVSTIPEQMLAMPEEPYQMRYRFF